MRGTNVSIRRKVKGDKAIVGIRFNDPFNTNRFRILAGDDNVLQLTARNFGARSTWLTFQYLWPGTEGAGVAARADGEPARFPLSAHSR